MIEATYGDREHPEPGPRSMRPWPPPSGGRSGAAARSSSRPLPWTAPSSSSPSSRMLERGVIPAAPIYLDSPMALAALEVYRRAEYQHEPQARRRRRARTAAGAPGGTLGGRVPGPQLAAAALHHHLGVGDGLGRACRAPPAAPAADQRNTVVLTGYQAVGTRGRALADGAHEVKIMGRYVPVRAEVVSDEEFSVHADASRAHGLAGGAAAAAGDGLRRARRAGGRRGARRADPPRDRLDRRHSRLGSASSSWPTRPRASSRATRRTAAPRTSPAATWASASSAASKGKTGRRRQTEPGGEGEELLAVASGVARHRADRALAEEVPLVVQVGCRSCGCLPAPTSPQGRATRVRAAPGRRLGRR